MWEVLTWQIPWAQYRFPVQIIGCLMGGKRPEIPARELLPGPDNDSFIHMDAYIDLLKRCWAEVRAQEGFGQVGKGAMHAWAVVPSKVPCMQGTHFL